MNKLGTRKKMAVLGAGAIGSSIGAALTMAGHDVILIDQWAAHVEAMKAHGLHVTMAGQELHTAVQAFHLSELCTFQPQLDIVFLAAKSYDSCWMAEFIKPYLKPDGIVVSTQNSINDEWIAPIIGYERDIGCAFELSAEVFEPGRVKRNTDQPHSSFVLGELHGRITPRVKEVAEILHAVGRVEISTNIWGNKWAKLINSSTILPLDAMVGVSTWEALHNHPEVPLACARLARQVIEVGVALGYMMESKTMYWLPEDLLHASDEELGKAFVQGVSHIGQAARTCIMQDLLKGRHTEVDFLNGLVVKKGREAGVPTPLHEAVTTMIREIERGTRKPSLSNLKMLQ